MNLRIGLGIDLHRLEPGRRCVLGGVQMDCPVGPAGHSDGDAVLHAVCDALLGAAGLDDLGTLFSDQDPANAGRDSSYFCQEVGRMLEENSLRVLSLDIVVECERPKLIPYRWAIRERLAALFGADPLVINVKGKTGELMGHIGEGKSVRATAVALVGPLD